MRSHYAVFAGDSQIGETCSGALSPSMGEGIAMAYLPPSFSAPGTAVEIEVRGRRYAATITTLPFYKKP
jgi:aminomethyltransferase